MPGGGGGPVVGMDKSAVTGAADETGRGESGRRVKSGHSAERGDEKQRESEL